MLREGELVQLTPKAFETLVSLVERGGGVLSKDELMQRVWGDVFVEDNNLSQNISLLRKVLKDSSDLTYIETLPKRGYRFAAEVTLRESESSATFDSQEARSASHPTVTHDATRSIAPFLKHPPETKYAKSGDINIAYQIIGNAPLDLVFVMGWVSHLEYFWAEPRFARFLTRLSSFSRLILFDKRGTGLSDRVPVNELPTLEQRMDDVRAVLDAVGSRRALWRLRRRADVRALRRHAP